MYKTLSKLVFPVQHVPNLFHDGNLFDNLSDVEVIERLTSMPNISVFMMVELLYYWVKISDYLLQNMTQIFTSKFLSRVPRRFVESFYVMEDLANLPKPFVSEDDTAVIVSEETTALQIVTTTKYYKFHFQHPATPQCENHTECGFMLKVTPCLKYKVGNYNIQLVIEESEYPADIHCHSEFISTAHMHLVMERYYELENIWRNMYISWKGRPEYIKKSSGAIWRVLCDNSRVRLVVYYDIREKK